MDALKKGWFTEINPMYPGTLFSLQVNKVLHSEKSEYQDVLIVETFDHRYHMVQEFMWSVLITHSDDRRPV